METPSPPCASRDRCDAARGLVAINAAFLAVGSTSLVVSYMAVDAVSAHLATALGLCCVALALLGLLGQRLGSLRPYGVLLCVLSLVGVWTALIAWFSADMAVRVFERLAASDWEEYFDTLAPSFRRQVLTEHPGCDAEYSGSCWNAVQEHTAGKYFGAARFCIPVVLSLGAGALLALKQLLGAARLVDDLDLALNYIVLLFGVAMVGTAAAEYGLVVTWVGRTACWLAICAGLTLIMITVCSFLTRAGSRSSAKMTRTITTTSSAMLDLCLFVLAQVLFVLALGCFLAKHTLVKSLHTQLDDHALQDVLAEYQHIAGCDDRKDDESLELEERDVDGFSCEASELAWADAERVFRRQLDTVGWSLLLAVLLVAAKLLCGRHTLRRAIADAPDGPSAAAAAASTAQPPCEEQADPTTAAGAAAGGGSGGGGYAALSLVEDEEAGISRSSPIPPGTGDRERNNAAARTGGGGGGGGLSISSSSMMHLYNNHRGVGVGGAGSMSRQASSSSTASTGMIGPIQEHSLLLGESPGG